MGVAKQIKASTDTSEKTAMEQDAAGNDKPPVDRAALEAWHALYVKLYGDGHSLPHAVESAKGFFHDRTVGRDRVHALFTGRKSGRKPTKTN
jgi:hypothetical protein